MSERFSEGVYLINSTGEATPLIESDGATDRQLLLDTLSEQMDMEEFDQLIHEMMNRSLEIKGSQMGDTDD